MARFRSLDSRSEQRIRESVKKTDRLRKDIASGRFPLENKTMGLLKDTLDAPTELGDAGKKQQVQVWEVISNKLTKTTREITVYNHMPGLNLSKGDLVVCEFRNGQWQISSGDCGNYEDKLTDGEG